MDPAAQASLITASATTVTLVLTLLANNFAQRRQLRHAATEAARDRADRGKDVRFEHRKSAYIDLVAAADAVVRLVDDCVLNEGMGGPPYDPDPEDLARILDPLSRAEATVSLLGPRCAAAAAMFVKAVRDYAIHAKWSRYGPPLEDARANFIAAASSDLAPPGEVG